MTENEMLDDLTLPDYITEQPKPDPAPEPTTKINTDVFDEPKSTSFAQEMCMEAIEQQEPEPMTIEPIEDVPVPIPDQDTAAYDDILNVEPMVIETPIRQPEQECTEHMMIEDSYMSPTRDQPQPAYESFDAEYFTSILSRTKQPGQQQPTVKKSRKKAQSVPVPIAETVQPVAINLETTTQLDWSSVTDQLFKTIKTSKIYSIEMLNTKSGQTRRLKLLKDAGDCLLTRKTIESNQSNCQSNVSVASPIIDAILCASESGHSDAHYTSAVHNALVKVLNGDAMTVPSCSVNAVGLIHPNMISMDDITAEYYRSCSKSKNSSYLDLLTYMTASTMPLVMRDSDVNNNDFFRHAPSLTALSCCIDKAGRQHATGPVILNEQIEHPSDPFAPDIEASSPPPCEYDVPAPFEENDDDSSSHKRPLYVIGDKTLQRSKRLRLQEELQRLLDNSRQTASADIPLDKVILLITTDH